MHRRALYCLTIALATVGAAVAAVQTAWGTGVRASILSVAIVVVALAGACFARHPSSKRSGENQKLSANLVALSSAAIAAVYAAGYHRTGSAEDRFSKQLARRHASEWSQAQTGPSTHVAETPTQKLIPPPPKASRPKLAPRPTTNANTQAKSLPPKAESVGEGAPAGTSGAASGSGESAVSTTSQKKYRDGVYQGWGTSRHGDIQASVLIQGGEIVAADVAQCLTRYSCSVLGNLPELVVNRQNADVGFVSGATESSYAFSDAVMDALSKAGE